MVDERSIWLILNAMKPVMTFGRQLNSPHGEGPYGVQAFDLVAKTLGESPSAMAQNSPVQSTGAAKI
jgi:hypothetical protein